MSVTVPFARNLLSRRPCADARGHDKRPRSGSGIWSCTLTTLTPLCINSCFSKLGDDDTAFIPASSLRGLVRSVAESLGAGCARYYLGNHPPELVGCTERDACLACRVFGFVEGDFAWAGKVRFTDTAPSKVLWLRANTPVRRPMHDDSAGAGWVLFPYSEPEIRPGPTRFVDARQTFRFRVEYVNLDEEEYSLLKFSLILKHRDLDLCHMLGYAKALGFGACTISIPSDKSPAPGTELDRYLSGRHFEEFRRHRVYR